MKYFWQTIVVFFLLCLTISTWLRPVIASAQLLDVKEARAKIAHGALLVDVRSPEEFAAGHVAEAINVPDDQIAERINEFGEDKEREILLYCKSGRRAGLVEEVLRAHGYKNVFNTGGYDAWREH